MIAGFSVLLAVLAIFSVGCNGDDPPPSEPKRMRIEEAPENMLANVDSLYKFEVVIEGDGAEADSIACAVSPANRRVTLSFALFDDGSMPILWGPEFASDRSGDIIPHDRKFTRYISGLELSDNGSDTGIYRFEFQPVGNFTIDAPVSLSIPVESVQNCVIRSVTQIHTIAECNPDFDIFVSVRPDESDEVDSVRYQIFADGELLAAAELQSQSLDTLWSYRVTPSFVRCLPSRADYSYTYWVKTRFGLTCTESATGLAVFNSLPVLSNSTLPDTIYRPVAAGDTDTVLVTVDLADCNLLGATDFYGLQFESYRDNQPWGRRGDFYLRDDGQALDAVAGDGHYSVGLSFSQNDTLPDRLYYFRFYAIEGFLNDCAPFDTSAYLLDSVRVIQPGALVGGDQPISGFDFGVYHAQSGR
jgi:hypothetical protein